MGVSVAIFNPTVEPAIIALGMIGGSLSLGVVSGLAGVYLSERAERFREVRELERKLGGSLEGSIYEKAAQLVPVYVALWSFAGMLIFPLAAATPYIMAAAGILSLNAAFSVSVVMVMAMLSLIGAYMGRISGEGVLKSALRAILLGVLAFTVVYAAKLVLKGFILL